LPSTVVGLNEPQLEEPQLTVQINPALIGSFVTAPNSCTVVLATIESGAGVELPNATAIGVGRIVKVTLLVCDGLLVTVAVMVTVVPIGTTDGAVNNVFVPSDVWAGLSVPQAPLVKLPDVGLPRQVTVQSTPALVTSFDGIMLRFSLEPTERATAGLVRPFAFAIEIGFAFTPAVELLPQPAIITPIKFRLTKQHR
jgi:hypothetical protein